MTTIATDGKTMAADGFLVSASDKIIARRSRKIHRVGESIIGTCGDAFSKKEILKFFRNGKDKPTLPDDFTGLLVRSGRAYRFNHKLELKPVDLPAAIGTRDEYAIGAMNRGATPREAIKIASKYDVFTGGRIIEVRI